MMVYGTELETFNFFIDVSTILLFASIQLWSNPNHNIPIYWPVNTFIRGNESEISQIKTEKGNNSHSLWHPFLFPTTPVLLQMQGCDLLLSVSTVQTDR